ncbi:28S ribosomal protein S6, mitochondrial [Frankliniella fusca]|uniref:28S ribosomal protein S6, mitochondrial n=1 Tax=Frankliniella fusca TaxID=407009 RepID=A0AAE1HKH2_9NEOP|nr:28S ribosomal protein S6, mitochondrial [Frankliniella fusca]
MSLSVAAHEVGADRSPRSVADVDGGMGMRDVRLAASDSNPGQLTKIRFTVETIVLHSLAEFTSEFTTTVRATVVKYNLSVVSKECPGSVPEIAVSFKRDSSYK